ncbi:olfactory receptor 6F1-like [Aquarana catesbeiana]|uniref:olfactory receptor 6F1-like n=1 Tax=Aquarana catesbeiana TaxID=8400 RepID=UPI003CC9FBAD
MQRNETLVTEFYLLGFMVTPVMEYLLFVIILVIYIAGIVINSSIIAIVRTDQSLHKPMYFFISVFSFLEVWYPTVTVPGLLRSLLSRLKGISVGCCIAQFYLHFSLGVTENFLLVVMAFDRYVAICRPLHYIFIMSTKICVRCALGAWIGGFLSVTLVLVQISKVTFCGPNVVDHYYCDFAPLIHLGCSDTSSLETLFMVSCGLVIIICFLLILLSYSYILRTILALPTSSGQSKAFYTCASHLTVVLIFYGTTTFMFVRPTRESDLHTNKIVSVFPSVVTPVLNPFIHTLRNHEVKSAIWRTIHCV